ncbi:putative cytochrome p450 protein [Eutypa lata UCREL1]|uniref:Putative cytochrome p450 protein n=1 Tax=Eutypa lata (strain UCR-EL1) TaxID=1287681 RepID=M7TEM6_EUTLA|nr:putative cytochrome p450 protein [Eutypa lata UCREL1]
MGPIASIFSVRDTEYRDLRAKAVAPLFGPAQVRSGGPKGVIGSCAAEFVDQLSDFRKAHVKTDLLDLCARLSIDLITGYLLGQRYGGLSENRHLALEERQSGDAKLSANPWAHAVVSWAWFSLLPNHIFRLVYPIYQRLNSSEQVTESFAKIDRFAKQIMSSAAGAKVPKPYYYHERLLQAGVSPLETTAQCQAIIFAGADSTAVMLVTTIFLLIQNRSARIRLLCEIQVQPSGKGGMPFLRAVVKEGLRLGMASPTRLTRVVPKGQGLRVGDFLLPSGTVVGCAAYNLHHDPDVFLDPFAFRPERWLDDGKNHGLRRPGMERSMMPFGAGSRACIGKNLAVHEIEETVIAVVGSEVLEGAYTCQGKIELTEWFNGDIKGHRIDIEWA